MTKGMTVDAAVGQGASIVRNGYNDVIAVRDADGNLGLVHDGSIWAVRSVSDQSKARAHNMRVSRDREESLSQTGRRNW